MLKFYASLSVMLAIVAAFILLIGNQAISGLLQYSNALGL